MSDFFNDLSEGIATIEGASKLRETIGDGMLFLTRKKILGCYSGRIITPIVCVGALTVSIALRIANIAEPLLVGIPADILGALIFINPFRLGHLLIRPIQAVRNIVFCILGSGKDLVVVGGAAFAGILKPKWGQKMMRF